MALLKIDKNVPLPPKATAASGRRKYPWFEMQIGDSFFVAGKKAGQLYSGASAAKKKLGKGFQFEIRADKGGTRVWRVKPKATGTAAKVKKKTK